MKVTGKLSGGGGGNNANPAVEQRNGNVMGIMYNNRRGKLHQGNQNNRRYIRE